MMFVHNMIKSQLILRDFFNVMMMRHFKKKKKKPVSITNPLYSYIYSKILK